MRLAAILILFAVPLAAGTPDEKDVLAAVQRLFDAMAARDTSAAAAVLLPDGRYDSIREDGTVGGATNARFIERLAAGTEKMLERMVNPRVMVRGRIATVWTGYSFYREGRFSHCGVDAFNLLKTADGWKIATFAYTMETAGCNRER